MYLMDIWFPQGEDLLHTTMTTRALIECDSELLSLGKKKKNNGETKQSLVQRSTVNLKAMYLIFSMWPGGK